MAAASARRFTPSDLIAGLSVAGLLVPESIAYAAMAGMPPGAALTAAIAGGLVYALVGRSRFAIVSPTSSSAALLAAALASLGAVSADRPVMAAALIGLVGLIFAVLALFRLGSLASFVSRPVLRGFALGIALTIVIRQLPKMMGFSLPSSGIGTTLLGLVSHISQIHLLSLVMGLSSLTALLLFRRFPRLPGALLVLATGITLASLFDLRAAGIALAGPVSLLPPVTQLYDAPFSKWADLAKLAAPLALILFAESWGTIRTMALRHGDTVSANRELAALGLANIASAALQGMPVGAGFSAGSANEAGGAQSRAAGLIAAIGLLLLALFGANWLARIPEPVLSAAVIAALSHALSLTPLRRLFVLKRDQWIAVSATVGVLLFGVLDGMLFAVVLSIASLLRDFARPAISVLGQTGEGGHDFVDLARHPEAAKITGVAVYRPNAPLFFANADSCLSAITAMALADPARNIVLSLEFSNDLDSTALETLVEFERQLTSHDKRLIFARAHDFVRTALYDAGLDRLAHNSTFSVADAVAHALSGTT